MVKLHKEVGCVGFVCPMTDQNVTFREHCLKCQDPCETLPVMAMLDAQTRPIVPNEYHVTEILNPRQVIYLTRNYPYYLPPESLVDAALGSAWHTSIYNAMFIPEYDADFAHRFEGEQSFRIEINGIAFTGTSDVNIKDQHHLIDYKTAQVFSVKQYLKEEWKDSTWAKYQKQINIYRVYQYPETEKMTLHVKVMGWDAYVAKTMGIGKTFKIMVPFIEDEKVKSFVTCRLRESVEDQETGNPPPCPKNRLWFNAAGEPQRCLRFCGGKAYCKQFKEWQEERGGAMSDTHQPVGRRAAEAEILP